MNLNKLSLVLVGLFATIVSLAQPYGTEWIDYNKRYFKFKVARNGAYQISRQTLESAGFPVSSVDPDRVQLFRRGTEVAISVDVRADQSIESIRFYGEKNSGAGDKELYVDPAAHLNPHYNLYTDSAAYFLTYYINEASGKRISQYSEANSDGLPAELYHLAEIDSSYADVYGRGKKYGSRNNIESSQYDYGEGWTGNFYKLGEQGQYEFIVPNINVDGPAPELIIQVVGGNNNQHNIDITAGPDAGNQQLVSNIAFTGFESSLLTTTLDWNSFGEDGSLIIQMTPNGVDGAADRASVAYISLQVPQNFEMNGSAEKYFKLLPNSDGKSFIRVNDPPNSANVWDISDHLEPIAILVNQSSENFISIIRNTTSSRELFVFDAFNSINNIEEIQFQEITPQDYNYLIVSHDDLRTTGDPVGAYAQYRSTETGGSYQVLASDINDLFDQYNYGDPSPLAIRRFADLMLDQGSPEFLFIIGKGTTVDANFYRLQPEDINFGHYVLPYGLPGSDAPFTAGLDNTEYSSTIPTGRINALTPEDVTAYLNKVIEMESAPYDDLSRKNTLHLSGGKTESEQTTFKTYIENFAAISNSDFLGGIDKSISKKTTDEVELILVNEEINKGAALVTFFGHSASSTADIEIGYVSEPVYQYDNKGKYPIFLINGCNAGSVYNASNFVGWGDDWILTPDLGAVGFIASVDRAFSTNLKKFSDYFYENAFQKEASFGSGMGAIIQSASQDFLADGASDLSIIQVQQFIVNGDPAVKIFGLNEPDYEVSETDVTFTSISNDLILTSTDSFYVDLVVQNFGRTTTDELEVAVVRTLTDGTVITYDIQSFERVLNQDTIQYLIKSDPTLNEGGTNSFEIILDPLNKIDEYEEGNNTVEVNFEIYAGSTSNLYPTNFGIVPSTQTTLVFQPSNILGGTRDIITEIDTASDFSSPFKNQSIITAELIGEWQVNLGFAGIQDETVFYWRTKLENPDPSESSDWVTSSFTYIEGSPSGWMQSQPAQLQQNTQTGISIDPEGNWLFESVSTQVDIQTFGTSQDLGTDEVIAELNNFDYTVSVSFTPCSNNTLNVLVLDRQSAAPYQAIPIIGDDVFNRLVCGRRPQVLYNFLEKDITGQDTVNSSESTRYFEQLINNAKEGDAIVMFNMGQVNYSLWDGVVFGTLSQIGVASDQISGLLDGQPLIIIGQKGAALGSATVISDNGSEEPILEQILNYSGNILGSAGEGNVRSQKIGPATSWSSYQQSLSALTGEDQSLTEIGSYDNNNNRSPYISNITEEQVDISSLSASDNPYVDLNIGISDPTQQTAPQLRSWKVLFEQAPDGILIDNTSEVTAQEGETITLDFGFWNYTTQLFEDDLEVVYSIANQSESTLILDTMMIAAPAPGDTSSIEIIFNTIGFKGLNDIQLRINTNEIPEQYLTNNFIIKSSIVNVEVDEVNPILDVTYDGKHIKNGEIISPNPIIKATLRDENQYLQKTDTIGVFIYYKPPVDTLDYMRLYFSNEDLSWSPATEINDFTITYAPDSLLDGWHGIRIIAEDASGNSIGEAYEQNFTIFTTPSLYNFKAFPNPFRNGVRFAFTITGKTPPDDMAIFIYNIHGKIVRILNVEDINIGENITGYMWDGTDTHGDNVSNGIYFYRIKFSSTTSRQLYGNFENSVGRLVFRR